MVLQRWPSFKTQDIKDYTKNTLDSERPKLDADAESHFI